MNPASQVYGKKTATFDLEEMDRLRKENESLNAQLADLKSKPVMITDDKSGESDKLRKQLAEAEKRATRLKEVCNRDSNFH
jgi:cell shape-determining protein MreC